MIPRKAMVNLLLLSAVTGIQVIIAWCIGPPTEGSKSSSISVEPSESFKYDPMLSNWLEFVPRKQEAGIDSTGVNFSDGSQNYEVGYLVGWYEKLAEHEKKEKQSNLTELRDDCDALKLGYLMGWRMCEDRIDGLLKESGETRIRLTTKVERGDLAINRYVTGTYSIRFVPSCELQIPDALPLLDTRTSMYGITTAIMPRAIYRSTFFRGWRETLFNYGCREIPLDECDRHIWIRSQPKPPVLESTHNDGRAQCKEAIEWLLTSFPEKRVREIARLSLSAEEIADLKEQIEVNIASGFDER